MPASNHPAQNGYLRNWITIAGIGLMLLALLAGAFLLILEVAFDRSTPYAGILYLACTGLILSGFLLVPAGMLSERRRRKSGHERSRALSDFRLDLSKPEHRYGALSLLATGMLVLVIVAVGANRAFHASESIEFCGQLCHEVMNPEWVRYHDSAHARVRCAECHIGEGADWFVKSKISGIRQVWAVTLGSFSRPIPTPIHDLRPARETCEECHWRRKLSGYKEIVRSYYLSDEANSLHQLRMLVKIGGEKTSFLKGSGIHYHMLIASKIEYIATDYRRQEIAWVRVSHGDGSVTEYNNQDNFITEEERGNYEIRTMDCMDCHNRPSHRFPTPMQSVNEALADGSISQALPLIKVQAVRALDTVYASKNDAIAGISNALRSFYRDEHPEIFERLNADLVRSIEAVQDIYRNTIFPGMRARWSAYPDNIGHRDSPGCFRCHNDVMKSQTGEPIFKDCSSCHVTLAQGESINQVDVNIEEGLAFIHPEDGDEIDEYNDCTDCHDGGAAVYED